MKPLKVYKGHKIFKLNDKCYVVDDLTEKPQSSIRKCKYFINEVLK